MAHDLVTELLQYSSLACFMPILQLCANLLIPNCLRSNLSYSPLAALELYVTNLKAWNKSDISIKATFHKNGKIECYAISMKPSVCWYEGLIKELKIRGYHDVRYERKEYWHYVKAYRSGKFRYSKDRPLYCVYDGNAKVFYPAEIECYCYDCYPSACLIFHY